MDDPNLLGFGVVLAVGIVALILGAVGSQSQGTPQQLPQPAPLTPDPKPDMRELQQQCQQLRAELQQQKAQLTTDWQEATFEQLKPLLTQFPTARKMAIARPELPAQNLMALLTPLERLLQDWAIEPIGTPWESVPYDPQLHEPDSNSIATGEPVYIRFVGYRQGDRILCPARVSRTLPGQPQTSAGDAQ